MYDITQLIPSDFSLAFCSGLHLVCYAKRDKSLCYIFKPWISSDGFLTLELEDRSDILTRLSKIYFKRCMI